MRGDTVALQASAWPVLDVLLSAWTHGDVREEGRCPAGGLVACFEGGQETGKPLAAAQQLRSSEELLYRGPPGEPNVLALQSDTRVPRAFLDRLQLIKQDRRRKSSSSRWIVVATLVRGQKGIGVFFAKLSSAVSCNAPGGGGSAASWSQKDGQR